MSPGQSRESIMAEIAQLDAKINDMVSDIPPLGELGSYPFPWLLWVVAAAGFGVWAYAEDIHPQVEEYKIIFLVAGSVLGVLALFNSFRALKGPSRGGTGRSRQISAQVEQLQRQRQALRQRLKEFDS